MARALLIPPSRDAPGTRRDWASSGGFGARGARRMDGSDLNSSDVNLNIIARVRRGWGALRLSNSRSLLSCEVLRLSTAEFRLGAVLFASLRVDQRHVTRATIRRGSLDAMLNKFLRFLRGPRHVCTLHRFNMRGWLVCGPGTQGRLAIIGSRRVLHGFGRFAYREMTPNGAAMVATFPLSRTSSARQIGRVRFDAKMDPVRGCTVSHGVRYGLHEPTKIAAHARTISR